MLTVSRVAGVGAGVGVAVTVEIGVSSGTGVGVFTGGNMTSSVGVGGIGVGVGVGSDCWQADNPMAMTSEIVSSPTSIGVVLFLRSMTESRIRSRLSLSFANR